MHRIPSALLIPAEIQQAIFSYLDQGSLRTCALVHRLWTASAQYSLYNRLRVTSLASLKALIGVLRDYPHLFQRTTELTIDGRFKDGSHPWARVSVDPITQLPHLKLLPRLRTLRFMHFDRVLFVSESWGHLRQYKDLSELHLHRCYLSSSHHIQQLLMSFPRLVTLTLDSVRWVGDRWVQRPEFQPRLQLRTLRICNPCDYRLLFPWLTSRGCLTVRHLELIRCNVFNLPSAAAYVSQLGASLESLTLGLCLPSSYDPGAHYVDLKQNSNLRSLSFQLYDVQDSFVPWVNAVLLSALQLRLERIALSFTLDNRQTLWGDAWSAICAALTTYWHPTLREVAFTHHAVPGFLQDVRPILVERLGELQQRHVLSVVVDRSQDV
ncbi:hypothetical protein BD414DRAFT_169308 [Trametes punicea]|nr:hypothetical protein BD414DRAFT_169308 [Trametes punicea]